MAKRLTVEEICTQIPNLSDEDRSKVLAACSFFGATNGVDAPPEDEDENFVLFYSTLSNLMYQVNGREMPKRVRYHPKPMANQILRSWKALDAFTRRTLPKIKTKQRVQFYEVVLLSIIEHINDIQIPLTLKTLCQQTQNCGAIMEKQFPGYLASGLSSMIITWGHRGVELEGE